MPASIRASVVLLFKVGALAVVVLATSACSSPPWKSSGVDDDRTPINGGFALSREQITELERKAEAGSIEACRRLSTHYGLWEQDERKALHWEERAAALGDETAKRNVRELEKDTSDR